MLKHVLETTGCFSNFKNFKILLYGLRRDLRILSPVIFYTTTKRMSFCWRSCCGLRAGCWLHRQPPFLLTTATSVHAQLRWRKLILLMSLHVCVVPLLPLSAAATAEQPPRVRTSALGLGHCVNTPARCQCHA